MSKIKKFLTVLVFVLPVIGAAACQSLKPALDSGVATATAISKEADKVIADTKVAVAALPDSDPNKAVLAAKLAKVEKAKADADKYIASATAAINSLSSGTLDPAAAGALGLLPYGAYIAGAVGVIGALVKRNEANGTLDSLVSVVKSWEAVGPPLTDAEKVTAAAIQGPVTSAKVESIKASL